MMTLVVIVALIFMVELHKATHRGGITDKRVVIPVASAVAAAYGVGATRRPVGFLLPLLVIHNTPDVDHPPFDVINVSVNGCFLGWMIGAPVGWCSRLLAMFLAMPSQSPCKSAGPE